MRFAEGLIAPKNRWRIDFPFEVPQEARIRQAFEPLVNRCQDNSEVVLSFSESICKKTFFRRHDRFKNAVRDFLFFYWIFMRFRAEAEQTAGRASGIEGGMGKEWC